LIKFNKHFLLRQKIKEIILIALQYAAFFVELKTNTQIDYTLILKHIYHEGEKRRILAQKELRQKINNYEIFKLNNERNFSLNIDLPCPGIFINIDGTSVNKPKLNGLSVICDNDIIFSYDKEMIKYVTTVKKIHHMTSSHSNALLESLGNTLPNEMICEIEKHMPVTYQYWLPFFTDKKWDNDKSNNYYYNENMKITFHDKITGSIILLKYNYLYYNSGLVTTQGDYDKLN